MMSSTLDRAVFPKSQQARSLRPRLSLCCSLFVVVFSGSSGCLREVPVDADTTSTTQGTEPEAGPDADTNQESNPSQGDDTNSEAPTQSPDGSTAPSEKTPSVTTEETTQDSDADNDSGDKKPDEDSGMPDPDNSGESSDKDDGNFDFVDELTGERPCSKDRVRWFPVESYRGERLSFPVAPVKALERAVLTGPCDATLIAPDLAITGAQCKIKPGDTSFALHRQNDASGSPRDPVEVKVDSIVESKHSAISGYEYTIFRLSKAVNDKAGWVKMAAIRLDKDEIVGMVHAPQQVGEVFSGGRVVSAKRDRFMATQSLHAQKGSQGAGVIDASGFLVATHVTGSCCDGTMDGCESGKELGWQSSFFAAYRSSKIFRDQLAAWLVGGPGDDFASDGKHLFGIQPGGDKVWKYSGTPDEWDPVGPAADRLYGGGGQLYARHKGTVSRYVHSTGKWQVMVRGLKSGDILDVDQREGDLYRLPADKQRVERLVKGKWNEIGGPASTIYAIHNGLLAESPDGSAVWRWNPGSNKWQELGPGGIAFVQSADGTIFRHDRNGVFEMRGSEWSKLAGPVTRVIAGKNGRRSLFAIDAKSKALMQYDSSSKSWETLGRPSRRMYTIDDRIFAVDDKSRDLVEYRPL